MKQPASASMRDSAKAALAEKEASTAPVAEHIDMTTGEIMPGSAAGGAVAIPPDESDDDLFYNPAYAEFDVVRQVTIPVLKWQAGQTIVVKVTSAMKLGKDISAVTKMQPPHLMVGEFLRRARKGVVMRTIICGAVLREELETQYPNDGYVGKWFTMRKLPRERFMNQAGEMTEKRYSLYQIIEIGDPTTQLALKKQV